MGNDVILEQFLIWTDVIFEQPLKLVDVIIEQSLTITVSDIETTKGQNNGKENRLVWTNSNLFTDWFSTGNRKEDFF